MMNVEVAVPEASNSIRSHRHPILESGNLSFPKGRYTLGFEFGDDRTSCTVVHRIDNAPLISRLLEAGQAQFACVISCPISSYREICLSADARQQVSWNLDDLGEPPLFTPMILCVKSFEITLDAGDDGLHRIWNGQSVLLHKGSRLALGSVIQLEASIIHLLSMREDTDLKNGQFEIDIETEPFLFVVKLSSDLYRFLQVHQTEHRSNIMTHVVTACLARLQKDFHEDDDDSGWKSYRNLLALADHLEDKGLGHWTDPEFRPEKAATALYPHRLPSTPDETEDP